MTKQYVVVNNYEVKLFDSETGHPLEKFPVRITFAYSKLVPMNFHQPLKTDAYNFS